MKGETKDVFLVLLIGIMTSPTSVFTLTGLCETSTGSEVCSACKSLSQTVTSLSRDCCGDPDAFAICSYCFQNPESCQRAGEILSDILNEMEMFEQRQTRSGASQSSYHVAPQRRAKYFLGKRNGGMSFPSAWDEEDAFDKRSRHFLGKRGSRHFLGKRFDDDDDVDTIDDAALTDKRVKLFLGKRDVSYVDEAKSVDELSGADASDELWDDEKSKRKVSPFLGKRTEFDDKAESVDDEDKEKRARPSPFLGKRADDGDDKTSSVEQKRGSSFFLGKRADLNSDSADKLEDIYVRPLTRRAKYFLGKRDDGHKRQKYFLGKRAEEGSSELSNEQLKRQKFFLGKRNTL